MIVRISIDDTKVFISSSVGYIWCIDIKTGTLLWKHKEDWAPEPADKRWPQNVPQFSEMDIIKDTIVIKGRYESRRIPYRDWYASAILIFDAVNGNLIKKTELSLPPLSRQKLG